MAYTSRIIDAPAAAVWAALIDPSTYPDWLIGTRTIRDIEDDWPAVGSGFHHSVGIGPFTIPDRTELTDMVPERRLDLAVKARPFVSACAHFELITDGTRTVVTLEEEPALPFIGNLVRPALDLAAHQRNHRSLCNLDRLITGGGGDEQDRRDPDRR